MRFLRILLKNQFFNQFGIFFNVCGELVFFAYKKGVCLMVKLKKKLYLIFPRAFSHCLLIFSLFFTSSKLSRRDGEDGLPRWPWKGKKIFKKLFFYVCVRVIFVMCCARKIKKRIFCFELFVVFLPTHRHFFVFSTSFFNFRFFSKNL